MPVAIAPKARGVKENELLAAIRHLSGILRLSVRITRVNAGRLVPNVPGRSARVRRLALAVSMTKHDERRCSKCKELHPLDWFCKDRSRKDGRHPWCKSCRKRSSDALYRKNHDSIRERQEKYRDENRELVRANNRASWRKYREKNLARTRKIYYANREARLEQIREYRQANPGYWKNWTRFKYRRELGLGRRRSKRYVKRLYKKQEGLCHWCGKPVGDDFHIDHVIPVSRGGSNDPSNKVISCPKCNWSKFNYLPEEWEEIRHLRT